MYVCYKVVLFYRGSFQYILLLLGLGILSFIIQRTLLCSSLLNQGCSVLTGFNCLSTPSILPVANGLICPLPLQFLTKLCFIDL